MKGKVIQSIFIILILLIGLFQIIPSNATAVGEPIVDLRFNEGEEVQYADVEPGESGQVSFQGTVSAEAGGGGTQDVSLELETSSQQGWEASITPNHMMLQSGITGAPFTVTVKVPTETSYYVEDSIKVYGYAENFPSGTGDTDVTPIYGTLKIKQYHRYKVSCDRATKQTTPGSKVQFELSIINEGNARDKFSLSVLNLDELDDKDITVTLDREMFDVPEKGTETIIVEVQTPEASIGESVNSVTDIELKVTSEIDPQGEENSQTYTLSVKVQSEDFLESDNFIILIIVIVVIILSIILFWKYKKSKQRFNGVN